MKYNFSHLPYRAEQPNDRHEHRRLAVRYPVRYGAHRPVHVGDIVADVEEDGVSAEVEEYSAAEHGEINELGEGV